MGGAESEHLATNGANDPGGSTVSAISYHAMNLLTGGKWWAGIGAELGLLSFPY